MTVDRSLIIPMFDESMRIESSLRALAASSLHAPDTELLLVDDGSTDDTAEVAERLIGELGLAAQVSRLPRNVGKGGAVQAGVAAAQGSAVAFVDADLSGPQPVSGR
jgi:glycosyltransferase involved in cell wall biosynthesis